MKMKIQATHPAELKSTNATFSAPIEVEVEADQIGDVVFYQSPTSGYFIAKNTKTGKVSNNVDAQKAVDEVLA